MMAAHIDSGTMVTPRYRSQTLAHLGLVAGMYDELEMGTRIDQVIPQDPDKRQVSLGQAVKAMVLNGLGFVNQRLYLVPQFFADKPTQRLLGPGICPEHLNDDVLGRALDKLYADGVTPLYLWLAPHAVQRLGVKVATVSPRTSPIFISMSGITLPPARRWVSSLSPRGTVAITARISTQSPWN
jgi:transposase